MTFSLYLSQWLQKLRAIIIDYRGISDTKPQIFYLKSPSPAVIGIWHCRFCVDKLSVDGYKLCIVLVTLRQISKYFL